MRPVWLIEAGVYGPEADPLLAEVRRQGMAGAFVPYRALTGGAAPVVGGRPLAPDDCVIGYGTFPFARQIRLHHPWIPGAWCTPENLDCTIYFTHFVKFLLNQPCAILPGVEAISRADELFAAFGRGGEVFVRPAGCEKLFVGRRIGRDAFAAALAPARYDPETRVVVAAPREVAREWRLVVVGDRVVAGSRYAEGGVRSVAPGCPGEVRRFAEAVLAEAGWRPDPAFMLDVCESEGRLWLVELNAFSTSWLYACDLPAVVAEASTLAERQRERAG
ncbi:MAG TPA: ATP-grasp domain-containing protein [Gemmataceae bacterium]